MQELLSGINYVGEDVFVALDDAFDGHCRHLGGLPVDVDAVRVRRTEQQGKLHLKKADLEQNFIIWSLAESLLRLCGRCERMRWGNLSLRL